MAVESDIGRQRERDHHAGIDVAADPGAQQHAGRKAALQRTAPVAQQHQQTHQRERDHGRIDVGRQQHACGHRIEAPGKHSEQRGPLAVAFGEHRVQLPGDADRQQIAQQMKTGRRTEQVRERHFGEDRPEADRVVNEAVTVDQVDEIPGVAQVIHRIGEVVLGNRREPQQQKRQHRGEQD